MEVLTASVRTLDHLLYALKLGSDIITAPYDMLEGLGRAGDAAAGPDYRYARRVADADPLREASTLTCPGRNTTSVTQLTDKGMERFSADWNVSASARRNGK